MSYCTLDDLKTYLNISESTEDVRLSRFIARAQTKLESMTDRVFEATADSTKYLDAIDDVGGRTLYLTSVGSDLAVITSITNGDDDELAVTDYVTEPRSIPPYHAIKLLASSGISWTYEDDHENAITVVGRWAHTDQAEGVVLPAAEEACLLLAAYHWHAKDNAIDLERTIIAGNATILPSQWPQSVRDFVKTYKRLV
ncbi:hypothetical protein LCGC14_0386710 [marine sediment metagenome]|uniref:Phage gp6-like head-tail connector protein n=1 Tax=marine sediment metagenome TaxID=412755 RepID=A0A0F9W9M2_9ZZZZ